MLWHKMFLQLGNKELVVLEQKEKFYYCKVDKVEKEFVEITDAIILIQNTIKADVAKHKELMKLVGDLQKCIKENNETRILLRKIKQPRNCSSNFMKAKRKQRWHALISRRAVQAISG